MAAPTVFVDTSFWIALFNQRDRNHVRARAWKKHCAGNRWALVTSEQVLWEWLNASAALVSREAAAQGYAGCQADPRIEIVPVERSRTAEAVALYAARRDKTWSLTDCVSFRIMEERAMRSALTADRDFQQAGFQALLLEEPAES
ncbi:MAG: PIN domain-containing protein [Planctomycetota bacterium]|nr:PIN domain-containing protein [Planctomycetota bacterium]